VDHTVRIKKRITVAVAGNPNSGKSTIFNMLTGAHQHVGNYPGVTVEKKEGFCRWEDTEIRLIDLPGTYSLTAYSVEELIARNFIIEEHPDLVVNVIDASNIERNLYLTTQLIEMEVPLILVFNMSDIARQRGLVFDIDRLSELLESPIVQTVGTKGQGRDVLLQAIVETARRGRSSRVHRVRYGHEIEAELEGIESILKAEEPVLVDHYTSRWLAVKLLENDKAITSLVRSDHVRRIVVAAIARLRTLFAEEPEMIFAERRYGFISGACQEAIRNTVELRHDLSDTVDRVLTHRYLGLPIFLLFMYIVFFLTFKIGAYPMRWLEMLFGRLGTTVAALWPAGADSLPRSLLVDGIIGGVGGVIVFLPNILLLFLAIAVLEDTGYMARAAFVMDRIMHRIGLHGKSFIPMLIGFGCSVPAIMGTRILENRPNRITTILVIPLMSCGARLTIYALLIPAFFPPAWRGPMLWLMYIIGIVLGVICAKVLRMTLLKGETSHFVMELPPYRMPTFKAVSIHMWHRGWMYLRKAGTVILGISIVLWFAMNFPRVAAEDLQGMDNDHAAQVRLERSLMGRIGRAMAPAVRPLGFDWKVGTALIGAMAAKEVFVAQLGIIYAVGEADDHPESLRERLQQAYTPLQGFCIMLFCLISAPCIATVAMTRQETGRWRWALFQWTALTAMAYVITLIVYNIGALLLH